MKNALLWKHRLEFGVSYGLKIQACKQSSYKNYTEKVTDSSSVGINIQCSLITSLDSGVSEQRNHQTDISFRILCAFSFVSCVKAEKRAERCVSFK